MILINVLVVLVNNPSYESQQSRTEMRKFSLPLLLLVTFTQNIMCNAQVDGSSQATQEKLENKALNFSNLKTLPEFTDQFWSVTRVPLILPLENNGQDSVVANVKKSLKSDVVPISDVIPLLRIALKSPSGTVYRGGIAFRPSSDPNSEEAQVYQKILKEKEFSFDFLTSLDNKKISSMYEKGFLEVADLNEVQVSKLKEFLGKTEVVDNLLAEKVSQMSVEDFKRVGLKFYFSSTDSVEVRNLALNDDTGSSGILGVFDYGRGIIRSAPYEELNSKVVSDPVTRKPKTRSLQFNPKEEQDSSLLVNKSLILSSKDFIDWLTESTKKKVILDKNIGSVEQFNNRKVIVGQGVYTQDQLSTLVLFALGVKSKVVSDIILISDDSQVSISEEILSPHRESIKIARTALDKLHYSSAIPFSETYFETREQSTFGSLTPPQKFFLQILLAGALSNSKRWG